MHMQTCRHADMHAGTHRRAVALDDVEDLAHALLLDLGFRDVGPVLQVGGCSERLPARWVGAFRALTSPSFAVVPVNCLTACRNSLDLGPCLGL